MNTKKKTTSTETNNAAINVERAHQFDDGSIVFDVTINGVKIFNCRLVEGKKGQFVSFPSRKGTDGNYYSHAFYPLSSDDTALIIAQIEAL